MKGERLLVTAILIINFIVWFYEPLSLYQEKTKLEIEKLKYELSLYKDNSENK